MSHPYTPVSPIDTYTIVATCPDCGHDGDVDAEAWLLGSTPTTITVEYVWTCVCGAENVEDREHHKGDDE